MNGAGGAAGTVLGGVITQELSWRWVLLINPPIGIAAAVIALPRRHGTAKGPRQPPFRHFRRPHPDPGPASAHLRDRERRPGRLDLP